MVHALNNAGINPPDRLQVVQNLPKRNDVPDSGPAVDDAHEDKIVYEITFDLPDAGLANNVVLPNNNVPKAVPNVAMPNVVVPLSNVPAVDYKEVDKPRYYPTRSCKSGLGHQPYNEHAPCVAFMHNGRKKRNNRLRSYSWGKLEHTGVCLVQKNLQG